MRRQLLVARYLLKKESLKILLLCVIAFLFGAFCTDILLSGYEQHARIAQFGDGLKDTAFLYSPAYAPTYALDYAPAYEDANSVLERREFERVEQILQEDERVAEISYFYYETWGVLPDGRTIYLFAISGNYLYRLNMLAADAPESGGIWLDSRLKGIFTEGENCAIQIKRKDTTFAGTVKGFFPSTNNKLPFPSINNKVPFPSMHSLYGVKLSDLSLEWSNEDSFVALTSYEALLAHGIAPDGGRQRIAALLLAPMDASQYEAMKTEFAQRGIGGLFTYGELKAAQSAFDIEQMRLIINVCVLFSSLLLLSAIGVMVAALEKHKETFAIFRLLGFSEKSAYMRFVGTCAGILALFSLLGYFLAPYVGSAFSFFGYQDQFILAGFLVPLAACGLFGIGAVVAWRTRNRASTITTVRRERA
ncbi:hypothetical protein FACS1894196_1730 [Clostridia bacterium]|nr:hypothetical protein FACS1894196_1730 [Clostridia bacterium]